MGVLKVHNKYGVLSLKEVLQPAIKYAQEGVYISPFQSYDIRDFKTYLSI